MYLLPQPQKVDIGNKKCFLSYDSEIIINSNCSQQAYLYARILQRDIEKHLGFKLNISRGSNALSGIELKLGENCAKHGYKIVITEEKILLAASENEGLLYSVQTLRQILSQQGAAVPCMEITDYPDIQDRGLYYDVTRGRIPTLDYLKKLADKLSYYKINQFQLYIEHTYMFKNLSEMWRDDTPLTAGEILELDAYCSERNIELVPSIATFGHLYKLLRTKTYRHLCEMQELCDKPFGFVDRMEHHTIDISNEQSIDLVLSMIDEYMALFRSDKFNICGDETMDLGRGKGKRLADEIGKDNMYISYVNKLCKYLISQGKTPMLWGDIICDFPEKIHELPKQVVYMNWEYEADIDDRKTRILSDTGAKIYNCPGVSGWDQLVNQIEVSYENIKRMCEYGRKYNVQGILNTDWGDCGHINHPDMGFVGIIYGACFSWNKNILPFDDINEAISVVEYQDKNKGFVKIISDISKLWRFKWRNLVNIRENREPIWNKSERDSIIKAEHQLENKKKDLLSYIAQMDTEHKSDMRAYILALDGMIILQKIGLAFIDIENNNADENMRQEHFLLAESLEKWFYHYKQEWRRVSRESELYRIQQVIFWTADYLRDKKLWKIQTSN